MKFKGATFSHQLQADFSKTLRKRVKDYFKTNNKSVHGNANMVIKTIFMVTLYLVPFGLMVSGAITNSWAVFGLWIAMGLGMSGIGLAIMHDANHGAYSKKKIVNDALGYLVNLLGGSAWNWKIQHNVLHHTYTNVDGMDEDIKSLKLLRFSPHQKLTKVHRFQFLYAWFFYSLMTVFWMTAKDFLQLNRYKKMDLLKSQNKTYGELLVRLIVSKIFYFVVFLGLPLLLTPVATWVILTGFMCMHLICGLILGCIFQPAHVIPSSEYPQPDDRLHIENNWLIHQLQTTCNFAPKSKIMSWFVGGLNFQIEHHLFPNVCHVHYKDLSKIVKKTAAEFGLPYHEQPTFAKAIWMHGKMLHQLGHQEMPKKVTA